MATLLLAEDDAAMRKFLTSALERAGHVVTACADGESAWSYVNEQPPGTYDLLVADIVMPRMDGIELSKKAAIRDPQIKVMFITGFTAVPMEAGLSSEKTPIIAKPFHLRELVSQIDRMLNDDSVTA